MSKFQYYHLHINHNLNNKIKTHNPFTKIQDQIYSHITSHHLFYLSLHTFIQTKSSILDVIRHKKASGNESPEALI